jgi:hypothetical protein
VNAGDGAEVGDAGAQAASRKTSVLKTKSFLLMEANYKGYNRLMPIRLLSSGVASQSF